MIGILKMKREADLNILCWDGYDDPSLLKPFIEEHNITARCEAILSDASTAERLAGGETAVWDVVNLNNPFAREYLYPRGLIRRLDAARFRPHFDRMLPQFAHLYRWAYSRDGCELIGICQRFGPFSLVVNTDRLARSTAEEEGFELANEPRNEGHYGVLTYDDFNIFHICIGAGLNPFEPLDPAGLAAFEQAARRWFTGARLVTGDHLALNRALIEGEIDFYLTGGVFTASPARLAGHRNIRAVTPRRGPIDGKGGIVFMEVTSIIDHSATSPLAEDFLAYLLRPEVASAVACAKGTLNPVTQMGDPAVMAAFSADQLDAIQWDSLEEDIARSAEYAMAPSYAELLPRLVAAKREAGWT